MRTRTSPRNQDILFKALFKPASEPAPHVPSALQSARTALANGFLSPRTRKHYEQIVAVELQRLAVQESL